MSDAILVYDDDCGFCTWSAEFVADRSAVEVVGFSDLDAAQRERLPEDYETCAHLLTDDAVYSCGAAMERAFVQTDLGDDLVPVADFLDNFDDYRRLRERVYREIADRRGTLGTVLSK